jgi:purine-nucleoside phosphorylase
MSDAVARSVAHITTRAAGCRPPVAIVLGSGWHGVADRVQGGVDIAYSELPAFPAVGVAGHAGTLRLG